MQTKNTARGFLKNDARYLAKIVEGTSTVTNTQKVTLGLNVRSMPTPIPPPADPPNLDIVSVVGQVVKVRLHAVAGDRRGKPPGVGLAFIYSFAGSVPPGPIPPRVSRRRSETMGS